MKKSQLTFKVFGALILFLVSCTNRDTRTATEIMPADTSSAPGSEPPGKNFRRLPGKPVAWIDAILEQGYDEPQGIGLISFDVADSMSKLYKLDSRKSTYTEWSDDGGKRHLTTEDDATAIWFSLEVLKDFISSIEATSPKREGVEKPKLGVRIYYAKYPDNLENFPSLRGLSPSVSNKHTVFMVPIYQDIVTKELVDFNVNHLGPDSSKPLPYYTLPRNIRVQASILGYDNPFVWYDAKEIGTRRILNHGGLSPPPPNAGTFPTPDGEDQ